MNIPTIGGARGVFEMLVPGVFMLINLVVVVYLFPATDDETRNLITAGLSNQILSILVGVIFGYLIGVVLLLQEYGDGGRRAVGQRDQCV